MELALLFILLPVAAASGWWLARRGAPAAVTPRISRNFSADYFKGLNLLLNEQPDKAIDVFVNMLQVDTGALRPSRRRAQSRSRAPPSCSCALS